MESNDRGKRKGFAKGKLVMMSFRRTTSKQQQHPASGSTTTTSSSGKVKPSQQGGGGNLHHHLTGQAKQRNLQHSSSDRVNVNQSQRLRSTSRSTSDAASSVEFIVNQENVTPSQPKQQRVSILLQETGSCDTYANVDSFYATVAADESVDLQAATYISSVRERFRV